MSNTISEIDSQHKEETIIGKENRTIHGTDTTKIALSFAHFQYLFFYLGFCLSRYLSLGRQAGLQVER